MISKYTFYKQINSADCGATCLRMISKFHGKYFSPETTNSIISSARDGVSLLGLSRAAEKLGYRTRSCQLKETQLAQIPLPAVIHWNQNHFVVLISFKKKITIADPAIGIVSHDRKDFLTHWISTENSDGEKVGTVLLLEPTSTFHAQSGDKNYKLDWSTYIQYFKQSLPQISRIFIGLWVTFLIQLIFPFLAQSMVDSGINAKDIHFITLILIAQLTLTLTNTIVGFISTRIQIRISNIVNISILSDFWIKLTRLPLGFFDNHRVGDIIQRLEDNKTIQNFITGIAMNSIFSLINFFVYSIILINYNLNLFIVYFVGNVIYIVWIRIFLQVRRKINYQGFHLSTEENNATIQLVHGMQELRLNNAEHGKRWEWENIQAKIFKLGIRNLNYNQWQSAGAVFINQGKDIVITYLVARLVVDGSMTFGAMLAVQYIIGQLGGPINNLVNIVQGYQDAKISMERLSEIHQAKDEEESGIQYQSNLGTFKNININNLNFSYPGQDISVLKNVNINIEENKLTAIVGMSGSGKTTLLKILMKILPDYTGDIKIGEKNFRTLSPFYWRKMFGSVMQDGFIFNDTIAKNIALSDELIDFDKLVGASKTANIYNFIDSLPNGWNTKIGIDGVGLSQGQRQRILIARAVYKNPSFIFLDEATNALDANNEKEIVENLYTLFENKTVIVVAHRLSTVKNANLILVMKNGTIVERGNHKELIDSKGEYFNLVKNQLELDG